VVKEAILCAKFIFALGIALGSLGAFTLCFLDEVVLGDHDWDEFHVLLGGDLLAEGLQRELLVLPPTSSIWGLLGRKKTDVSLCHIHDWEKEGLFTAAHGVDEAFELSLALDHADLEILADLSNRFGGVPA